MSLSIFNEKKVVVLHPGVQFVETSDSICTVHLWYDSEGAKLELISGYCGPNTLLFVPPLEWAN